MEKRSYTPQKSLSSEYNMNFDWKFCKLASSTWPLRVAMDKVVDSNSRLFYNMDYDDTLWKIVSVPHTFNDEDSFDAFANDAGGFGSTWYYIWQTC